MWKQTSVSAEKTTHARLFWCFQKHGQHPSWYGVFSQLEDIGPWSADHLCPSAYSRSFHPISNKIATPTYHWGNKSNKKKTIISSFSMLWWLAGQCFIFSQVPLPCLMYRFLTIEITCLLLTNYLTHNERVISNFRLLFVHECLG